MNELTSALEVKYMNVKTAAEKWGIKEREVRKYYQNNLIPKADKVGGKIHIPIDQVKPMYFDEVKTLLLLIIKAQNYLVNSEINYKELNQLFNGWTPVFDYLFDFGYILYSDEAKQIANIFYTPKAYNLLLKKYKIKLEIKSSTLLELVLVATKVYYFYLESK